jgi:dinuclear metal center YbgI/SA1388 family protein
MQINSLVEYLNQLLDSQRFNDYCPNGLQVHGRDEVKKVVAGVTASLDFLKQAVEQEADTVIVHHGYFWKNENATIVGLKKKRIEFLLANNINLIAYHLPLDAHTEFGNNVQLAKRLDLHIDGCLPQQNLVLLGRLAQPMTLAEFSQFIQQRLNRQPLCIGDEDKLIRNIAWCTGAAQSYFSDALSADIDVYLSGEISENTVHTARESGVAYISAGHHATERYGVQALAAHLSERFALDCSFVDIDNPV